MTSEGADVRKKQVNREKWIGIEEAFPSDVFQSRTIMFLWMRGNEEMLFGESGWKSQSFVGLWLVMCVRERVCVHICVCLWVCVWPSSPRAKSVCYNPSSAFLKVLSQRKANPISFNGSLLRIADFIRIHTHGPFSCPSSLSRPSLGFIPDSCVFFLLCLPLLPLHHLN